MESCQEVRQTRTARGAIFVVLGTFGVVAILTMNTVLSSRIGAFVHHLLGS